MTADLAIAETAPAVDAPQAVDWDTLLHGARPSALALARLAPEQQARVNQRLAALDRIAELRAHLTQGRAIELTAPALGLSRKRWEGVVLEVKRVGWRALLDRREISALWSVKPQSVDRGVVDSFSRLMLQRQRPLSGRAAFFALREQLPQLPRGCSYANLMRLAPDKLTRLAVKQGRTAAAAERAPVRLTRAEGRCMGRVYLDDVWLDQIGLYASLGKTPQIVRGVGAGSYDYYSGKLFSSFFKPRFRRPDGTSENVSEWEVTCLTELNLRTIGYSPDGTVYVVENQTATLRRPVEEAIRAATDGLVTVERGGIQRHKATQAQWGAKGGGNPRTKSALETLWNLLHNRLCHLPGQLGLSPSAAPEESAALERYTLQLVKSALHAQGGSADGEVMRALQMPVLWWEQLCAQVSQTIGAINQRTDHELEGWDAHRTIDAATGKVRRKSPAEVMAEHSRDLVRIDDAGSALILAPGAKACRVRKGEIAIPIRSLSGDDILYAAGEIGLRNDDQVKAVVNELAPDRAFVFSSKGEYIGAAPRVVRADAFDSDARVREYGRASRLEVRGLSEARRLSEPAAAARRELQQHNERVIAEATEARRSGRPLRLDGRQGNDGTDGVQATDGPTAPAKPARRFSLAKTAAVAGGDVAAVTPTAPESTTGGVTSAACQPARRKFRLGV